VYRRSFLLCAFERLIQATTPASRELVFFRFYTRVFLFFPRSPWSLQTPLRLARVVGVMWCCCCYYYCCCCVVVRVATLHSNAFRGLNRIGSHVRAKRDHLQIPVQVHVFLLNFTSRIYIDIYRYIDIYSVYTHTTSATSVVYVHSHRVL